MPLTARFRTVYLARRRRTAFCETLQDLRPSTKGADRGVGRARIDEGGRPIIDLEDLSVRRALEERHAALLAAHGMRNLDISQVRSPQRVVTQTIALDLHGRGYAGIAYNSNLDGGPCVALFEGRATIRRYGKAQPIDAADPDLTAVCRAWGIAVE